MKRLDLTLATPAENLACDEALLDLCEKERVQILRFWESRQHFVVVGYGNHVAREVDVEECSRRGVPILRRCSGGGTVMQGPGCLNYTIILQVPEEGPLTTVTGTNEFVMERNRVALEKLLGIPVAVQGHTDLAFHEAESRATPSSARRREISRSGSAIVRGERRAEDGAALPPRRSTDAPFPTHNWLKFSGNAQRRRRRAVLFHGTILYAFDLSLIEALLRFPSAQPAYRAGRPHTEFLRNVPASADEIRGALRGAWNAETELDFLPNERIAQLVREQYANDEWNLRR